MPDLRQANRILRIAKRLNPRVTTDQAKVILHDIHALEKPTHPAVVDAIARRLGLKREEAYHKLRQHHDSDRIVKDIVNAAIGEQDTGEFEG